MASGTALMNNYGERRLTLVRGEGPWVWDSGGKRYLDAISGIAVCGLGHAHPEITRAIAEQASTLVHCSNLYNIPAQQQLATALCATSGMDKVFFGNSGAEANEAAIKLARKFGHDEGRFEILTAHHSFHGRTLAGIAATLLVGDRFQEAFDRIGLPAGTQAKAEGKLVFVNFTGYTCTNCRWMEANVFIKPEVETELGKFVLAKLFTDGEGEIYERQQRY